jgi:hypothetical protein
MNNSMKSTDTLTSPIDAAQREAKERDYNTFHAQIDPLGALDKFRITALKTIPVPEPRLCIHGAIICTPGNLACISGMPKVGKTALIYAILIAAINANGTVDDFEGISVAPNVNHYAVVHLDSESAAHLHRYQYLVALSRAGHETDPDNFYSYNLVELAIDEYLTATESICRAAKEKHGGIHIVLIDGPADFISDVNDAEASNSVIKRLHKLAKEIDCPIILVVHTNPNSDKERGHLGSQLQRKCESVIQVKSENDISYIEPRFLRNAAKGNVPLIQFVYDQSKGYHVTAGIKPDKDTAAKEQAKREAADLAGKVFGQKSFKYAEAWRAIAEASSKGDNKAKHALTTMLDHGFINKDEHGYYRLSV